MKARAFAHVGADHTLRRLRCEPPLTLRRVHSDDDRLGLCLVGSAAGPLPGDDLALDLQLEPRARATLTATGASIAQGRTAVPATLAMHATLGEGAQLVADPGPLVVCAGAHVDVAVSLDLAATASVSWRELVVLGRSTDAEPGAVTIRWDVTRAGRPVLRQFTDLADPALRHWPGTTAGRRVLATTLLSGPGVAARTLVASPTAVAQQIDAHTVLVTVLGHGAAEARSELAALEADLEATHRTAAPR